jgi:transmembrane sensor
MRIRRNIRYIHSRVSELVRLYLAFYHHRAITIMVVVCCCTSFQVCPLGKTTTYSTSMAETRSLLFPDGVELTLNAKTEVVLKEASDHRTAELVHGEIHARVIHGMSLPLNVVIGKVLIQDLGTEFDVASHDDVITVAVTAGRVRVMEQQADGTAANPFDMTSAKPDRGPTYLVSGDMARLEVQDGVVFLRNERHDQADAVGRSAWMTGEMRAKTERLDELLWQLNAYHSVQIRVADPTIAESKIGGIYSLKSASEFLKAVELALNLETVPVKDPNTGEVTTYILRMPVTKDDHARPNRHK